MTTREFYPPGYDPTLDRIPPRSVGCGSTLLWIVLLSALLGICGGILFFSSRANAANNLAATATEENKDDKTDEVLPQAILIDAWDQTGTALALVSPTASPTIKPTLDEWSLTGTAISVSTVTLTPSPTPTIDYCYWLTPTATPSPTLIYTPDSWQATGTAVFYLTNTPTPEMLPTQAPPRAWCDITLTPTPETITPDPNWTNSFQPLNAIDTLTPVPTQAPPVSSGGWIIPSDVEPTQPILSEPIPMNTPEPRIVVVTQVQQIVHTSPPQMVFITPDLSGIWGTMTAQVTPSLTPSPSYTPSYTNTWTYTPSYTFTPSPTFTETATATATLPPPTHTFTFTWTYTPSLTFTFTPTFTETATATATATLESVP